MIFQPTGEKDSYGKACRAAAVGLMLALLCLCLGDRGAFGAAQAEEPSVVRMAVGAFRPPYVMADQKSGLEIELIEQLFQRMDKSLQLVPLPNSRAVKAITYGQVDGVSLFTGNPDELLYLSDVVLAFQNVALARVSLQPPADSLSALTDLRVVAFQNACNVLGVAFRAYCSGSPLYMEVPDQATHLPMLWNDRIDVVIGEIRVLDYFQRRYQGAKGDEAGTSEARTASGLMAYKIFKPTYHRAAFISPGLRDEFNRALAEMKQDGSYQALLDRYQIHLPVVALSPVKADRQPDTPFSVFDVAFYQDVRE
ncbi:substrate-binding periplasmic protein [Rhodovibrionaceae bacterium A322]